MHASHMPPSRSAQCITHSVLQRAKCVMVPTSPARSSVGGLHSATGDRNAVLPHGATDVRGGTIAGANIHALQRVSARYSTATAIAKQEWIALCTLNAVNALQATSAACGLRLPTLAKLACAFPNEKCFTFSTRQAHRNRQFTGWTAASRVVSGLQLAGWAFWRGLMVQPN
eukprot:jgi/Ulvmu1/7871/UM004_0102.1